MKSSLKTISKDPTLLESLSSLIIPKQEFAQNYLTLKTPITAGATLQRNSLPHKLPSPALTGEPIEEFPHLKTKDNADHAAFSIVWFLESQSLIFDIKAKTSPKQQQQLVDCDHLGDLECKTAMEYIQQQKTDSDYPYIIQPS